MYCNTTGSNNVAIGCLSLYCNTTGASNIAIGALAGCALVTGANNTVIGSLPAAAACVCTLLIGAGTCERIRVDNSGLYINGTAYTVTTATNATNATNLTINTTTTNANFYLVFVSTSSGTLGVVSDAGAKLTYNPSTSVLNVNGTAGSNSTTTGALQVVGGVGVGASLYVGNRVGYVNTSNVSVVYQYYNTATNSLDTVFG